MTKDDREEVIQINKDSKDQSCWSFHFIAFLTQQQEITKKTIPMVKRARLAAERPITAGRQVQSGFQMNPFWHSVQQSQSTIQVQHPTLHSILQISFSLLQVPVVKQQATGRSATVDQPTTVEGPVPLLAAVQVLNGQKHLSHLGLPASQYPDGQSSATVVWTMKNAKKITAIVFIFILIQRLILLISNTKKYNLLFSLPIIYQLYPNFNQLKIHKKPPTNSTITPKNMISNLYKNIRQQKYNPEYPKPKYINISNNIQPIMDIIPSIQPNIQQLELEASFSSSSGQSDFSSLLDMSDIVALCDRDVRLTTDEIKSIFKALCNRIFQLQLGKEIKDANLRMSGDLAQVNDQDKKGIAEVNKKSSQQEKDRSVEGETQFNIQIKEKTMSQMENKRKQSKSSKGPKKLKTKKFSEPENHEEMKIKKRVSERPPKQKKIAANYQNSQLLEKRLAQIQAQLYSLQNIFKIQPNKIQEKVSGNGLKQEILEKPIAKITSDIFSKKGQFLEIIKNPQCQLQNYQISEVQNGLQVELKGKQPSTLRLQKLTQIKIQKMTEENIEIGLNKIIEGGTNTQAITLQSQYLAGDTIKIIVEQQDSKLKKVQWFLNDSLKTQKHFQQNQQVSNWQFTIKFTKQGDKVLIN